MMSIFLPRGIRNNNPGNIRLSKTVWQGQRPPELQIDRSFIEFTTALYGLRALMKIFLTYYLKYNLDTVESIVNRFAPPHENNTDGYIYNVAKALHIKRTDKINLTSPSVLSSLTRAVVLQENGKPPKGQPEGWYVSDLYDQAAKLVLPVTA